MIEPIKYVKGKKIASYPETNVFEGFPHNFYEVGSIQLSDQEKELALALINFASKQSSFKELEKKLKGTKNNLARHFKDEIVKEIEKEHLLQKLPKPETYHRLKLNLVSLLGKSTSFVRHAENLAHYVLDYAIGYGPLGAFMRDPHLEEIMVNGYNKNVFVLHKEFGMCKTNILIEEDHPFIFPLLTQVANLAERRFDAKSPLLDARLPDGSRANATFPTVTPFGPSFTIRKFNYIPLSVIDLIEKGTLSSELAAFLWVMVEGMNIEPKNLICTGGTSSGKTTTLNALNTFIHYRDRIVTIEDTIELDLGSRENWVRMEAKPKTKETPQITMDELLQNALRMRPDRIVVGEVRGNEAQTLFVAMDTGHAGTMGTLHANTARELLVRLKNPPMNVPEQMLPLLNLILVQYRLYHREKGLIRRVGQVAEISRMEEQVLLSNLFEWDTKKDVIYRTDIPSHLMQDLSEKTGLSKNALKNEMAVRQKILEWMMKNKIKSNPEVERVIQQYYFDPDSILDKVKKVE